MLPPRKVILYISMSLDGFLATEDDGLDWLDVPDHGKEDYGYADFTAGVDTYIVGRRTYDIVRGMLNGEFPQAGQFDCYVITREPRPPQDGVTFYSGDISELIAELRTREGGNIYCDGGSQIVQLLMQGDLIDEYIVSVIPVLLGRGIRLFLGDAESLPLRAMPSTYYPSGLTQLRYERIRE